MMPSKGAGRTSLFVFRLALIQSAKVVLHLTQYASNVAAHYLSSWDRRVTFGWDKYTAGDQLLFCKLGSGNSDVVLPPSDSDTARGLKGQWIFVRVSVRTEGQETRDKGGYIVCEAGAYWYKGSATVWRLST